MTAISVGAQSGSTTYGDTNSSTFSLSFANSGGGNTTLTLVVQSLPPNTNFSPATISCAANPCTGTLTVTPGAANVKAGIYTFNVLTTQSSTTIGTGTYTRAQRSLTVTAAANSKTYDGTTSASTTPTIAPGLVSGDTSNFIESYADKNVGTNKQLVPSGSVNDGTGGSNYTITFANSTNGTINALPITVTAAANSKTYDGNASASATPTVSPSLVGTDTGSFTEVYADKNVGTNKQLTPSGTVNDGNSGSNYTITFASSSNGTISARALTVSAAGQSRIYDGTVIATVTLSDDRVAGDTLTASSTGASFADKHTGVNKTVTVTGISVSGTDAGNYTANNAATTTANINARSITMTAAANSKTYDGNTSASVVPTITSGSIAPGDTANFTESYSSANAGTNLNLTPAGSVIDGNGGSNYSVTLVNSANGTINARPITVTAAPNSKNYDGNTSATATPTVTSGSLAGTDSATWTESYAFKNTGTGLTLTPTGTVNDGNGGNNYIVTFANNANGVITARALTVTAAGQNKEYDGSTTATVLLADDRIPGDAFTDNYTSGSFADRNAGTGKTVTVSGISIFGADAGNYNANATTTATANITPRAITVTAASSSKTYDGTTSSSGVPTITSGTLAAGDSATWTQAFAGKNIGTGLTLIPAGTVSDGNSGNNYAVTLANTTSGTITARAITVTAVSGSKTYDGTTSSSGVPAITLGNLAAGDSAAWTQTFDNRNVGAGKTLTPAGTVSDGNSGNNYSVTLVNDTNGVIATRAMTVTASADSKAYDGTMASTTAPTLTSGSLAVGDSVVWTQAFTTRNVGSGLTLVPAGTVNDGNSGNNYSVTFVNSMNGTITGRAITVTASANSKIYDNTTAASAMPAIIVGSLAAGDTANFTETYANENVGTGLTLIPAGSVNDGNGGNNYAVTLVNSANGTITARAVTVTAVSDSKSYDGTTGSSGVPTITSGLLAVGDSAAWTQTFDSRHVGTGKTLTPAGTVNDGNSGNNYAVTFANTANGTITARAITVTAAANSKSYDGTTDASAVPTVTLGTLATGDTAGFTEVYAGKNVGTGLTLIPAGSVNDGNSGNNYAVTLVNSANGTITARAVTVTAVSDSKSYDGTTGSSGVPTITSGLLAAGDSAAWTQTFDSRHVGTGKTLTPAGTVNDGNSGGNYTVTLASSTNGSITSRVITVTAAADSKTYDRTTSSAGIPTITSGTLATGDSAAWTQTFDNRHVGSGKTLTPAGSVNDGNGGDNYAVTFAPSSTGSIGQKAVTVSGVTANDKLYDGDAVATLNTGTAALVGVINPDAVTLDTAGAAGSFADASVGAGKTVTVSGLTLAGADGGNYSLIQPMTTASIINTNPVFSNTSPASDSFINTATVGYMLNKLVTKGTGTITFTWAGGTPDAGAPRYYILIAADMTAGSHTINTGLALVNGAIYDVSFDVTDDQGYAAVTVTNTNIHFDASAASVTLLSPASGSNINNAMVTYSLSKEVTSGKIIFTSTGGSDDPASPHVYSLQASDMTGTVHTVDTGLGLVDGAIYTVSMENIVDLEGNSSAVVSNTGVRYDSTSVSITITSPLAGGAIATATVSYTLSEQAATGAITFTRTGGADGAASHVYTLSGAELATGPHTLDTALGLTDGAIYTVSMDATDLAGNAATTVSNAAVTFDQSAPVGSIILNNGVPMTANAAVNVHLEAADSSGTVGYLLSEGDSAPAVDDPAWVAVASTLSLSTDALFTVSPGDGPKAVYAWFKDGLGHVSTSISASITVDTSGTAFSTTQVPGMVISALPDGSHTTESTMNVTGMVADPGAGQTVLVGSDPATISPDGSFSVAVALLPGENVVQVTIIDASGNQATVTRTIIYDPAAPVLTITTPADGTVTARNTIGIAGSADPLASVTIRDNAGGVVPVSGHFSATANLDPGLNTIVIVATGATGSATAKRTVFYDFAKPGLTISMPATDVTITSGTVTVAGQVSDALTDVTVAIVASGQTYTPAVDGSGNFSQTMTFADEGIYPVVVTATDLNKNSSTVQRNVRYQRGYVVINRGAAATTSTTVTLDLGYSTPTGTVSTMQLLYNNTAWTSPMAFAAKKTVTLPSGDGVKSVSVRFIDSTGAVSAFYSDTIILDTKVPVGTISINGGSLATTVPTVTLSLAVTDANGVVKMQFSDNGTKWSTAEPFASTKSYTLFVGNPATAGVKRVYARFIDGSGKVSAAVNDVINYASDLLPSAEGQVVIKNGDVYTTTTTVPVLITNPSATFYSKMRTSTNGTTWTGWTAWSAAVPSKTVNIILPTGDGIKTVYVQFMNAPGRFSLVYSDSIILDTIGPKGSVQINGGAYSTNSRIVTLTLAASDLNGVKEMQFSLTNSDWATRTWEAFNGTKTITLPLGDGVKTVWVKFMDNAGKISAVYTDTILVDTLAPTGKVLINAGAKVITSRTVTLSFSAPGSTYMRLSLDGGATWGGWEPYTLTKKVTLPSGDGTKTVQVKFRDVTGNESGIAGASASYTLAKAPATITIPALDSDGTYSVIWSASTTTGVTYVLQEATNDGFTAGLRTAYSGSLTSANITLRVKGLTYYYRVQAKKTGLETSSWTVGNNGCNVGPASTPGSITVPLADADGTYAIRWGASTTPGATYVVEEATDKTFTTNLQPVYSGTARTFTINGNAKGATYYYRVKAQAAGFPDSTWKTGANGCKVS